MGAAQRLLLSVSKGFLPSCFSWFVSNHAVLSFSVRKRQLPVKVCPSALQLHMRGKEKSVSVQSKPGQTHVDFKKSKDGFVLLVPAN